MLNLKRQAPRVTVGLPVFNGQKYLAAAIESQLSQTYTEFELIISDNASNDGTQQICQEYVRKDSRIRYVRQAQNIGANRNHVAVFELASEETEFFRWAAADDLIAPTVLEEMIFRLDSDSRVIAVVPDTVNIGEDGEITRHLERTLDLQTDDVLDRVEAVLTRGYQMVFTQGLIRKGVLRSTARRWGYFGWDFILLLELAMRGRLAQPTMAKLYRRQHGGETSRARTMSDVKRWVEPGLTSRFLLPHWRWAFERARAVLVAPLPALHKMRAMQLVAAHTVRGRHALVRDLVMSTRMVLGKSDEIPF